MDKKISYVLLLIVVVFFTGLVIGRSTVECFPNFPCGFIPSDQQVDIFCQSEGFDYGWVFSGCGANEVNCHKEFSDGKKMDVCLNIRGGQI